MKVRKNDGPGLKAEGLLLLKKEPGLTSFESLAFVKKALSTGKVGHTGTLDKFAGGLLLVLAGRAGKLASLFSCCDKEYEGLIRFGAETDTLDPEGAIVAEAPLPSRVTVEEALPGFRGGILQAPPAYSAIHIDGARAHELSRRGLAPEMKKRPVTVSELELFSWEPPFAGIRVRCSAGTYIRSLARDIALAAGSRAYLAALTRTRIGGFYLKDAFDPASLGETPITRALRPVGPDIFDALELPCAFVREDQGRMVLHGRPLERPELKTLTDTLFPAPAAGVFNEDKALLAVLEQNNGRWKYKYVFSE